MDIKIEGTLKTKILMWPGEDQNWTALFAKSEWLFKMS